MLRRERRVWTSCWEKGVRKIGVVEVVVRGMYESPEEVLSS